jgi:hypothetical protein
LSPSHAHVACDKIHANTRVDWSAPNVLVWPNNIARADGFVRLYNWGGSTEETVKKKKVVYYILWGYCN